MPNVKVDLAKLQEMLATHDNEALALHFGVTPERIRQLRRAAEGPARASRTTPYSGIAASADFRSSLGKDTDANTAQKFGVPVNVVHHARVKAGIPSFAETRRQEMIPLLGKVPDQELAKQFGYSINGVITLRERLQIAAPENNGTVGRRKAARAARERTPVKPAAAKVDVELTPPAQDVLDFLRARHQVGDSTEALAARLEIPEARVKQLLGLS